MSTTRSTLRGPPLEAVRAIKARIRRETGRPASAGLAANKFIAKVASDLDKPDGLGIVEPSRETEFLAPLPIERLWGVGKATAKGCGAGRGHHRPAPAHRAARAGGAAGSARPGLAGAGLRARRARRRAVLATQSMGAETTFGRDCREPARLEETLRYQAERVARELRAEGLAACRVTLKLPWADFRTLTRSHTGDPTQDGLEIYRRAATLPDPAAVRREQFARAIDRTPAASAAPRACPRGCSAARILPSNYGPSGLHFPLSPGWLQTLLAIAALTRAAQSSGNPAGMGDVHFAPIAAAAGPASR